MSALPEHVSGVIATSPINGTVQRRAPRGYRTLATRVETITVDPRIMAAAKSALRPGERLVIVGPGEVRTSYA